MRLPQLSNVVFGVIATTLTMSLALGLAAISAELRPDVTAVKARRAVHPGIVPAEPARYVIALDPGSEVDVAEGPLVADDGTLYVNPDAGPVDSAGIAEIEQALAPVPDSPPGEATLAVLSNDARVDSVVKVDADHYLVTTAMSPAELSGFPGVTDVVVQAAVNSGGRPPDPRRS